MRAMIRSNFKAQVHVTDPQEISRLKMQAIVGLQNYVVFEQTGCVAREHASVLPALPPELRERCRAQESDGQARWG